MDPDFETSIPTKEYPAHIGVTHALFEDIYSQYGRRCLTKHQFWHLLHYFKCYPKLDVVKRQMGCKTKGAAFARLTCYARKLAVVMEPILPTAWENRHDLLVPEDVRDIWSDECKGYVDSFPICIWRPKDSLLRKLTYSGKYKDYVLKVQVISDHTGCPVWYTGPHLGVVHDTKLWKEYHPEMGSMVVLGDQGYVGCGEIGISHPWKRRRGEECVEPWQADWNAVHSWFRATVEHAFSQVKKFEILGGRYRGRLTEETFSRIGNIVLIILSIVHLQVRARPLKDLSYVLAGISTVRLKQFSDRNTFQGLPLGETSDLEWGPDGSIKGPGPEPSDADVNTGITIAALCRGKVVYCWWWGLWWPAKVVNLRVRKNEVDIKFKDEDAVIKNYPLRLVYIPKNRND